MSLNAVLERLPDATRSGAGWLAKCPSHDDRTPSLSVSEASDGRVLVHCHAGCTVESIVTQMGLEMSDLRSGNGSDAPERRIVAQYPYRDESGELLYEVVRYEPKDFRQRRPDGNGGWVWKLGDVRRVLYKLPEVIAADPTKTLFVVEGERDVQTLEALGLLATCNSGGAGKWRPDCSDALRGRRVVILPDNDEPGKKHAQMVAESLHGVAQSIKVLSLSVPPAGDVSDWLGSGHTRKDLEKLAEEAAEWTRTVEQKPPTVADLLPAAFVTGLDLLSLPRLPRVPLLANKMFFSGCYGLIYGPDGSAKSLAALHLLVCLASGRPWFGFETHGPVSVAYVQTDDDRDETTDRLIPIAMREKADDPDTLGRIHILARPWPWGSLLDLVDTATQSGLLGYLVEHAIRLLAVDHVASCHACPAYDFRPLIAAASRIAEEGDCAVLFVAHPSKAGNRAGADGIGADDVYGDSRFRNQARLRIRMSETKTSGVYRMKPEKTSRGVKPEPVFLAQTDPDDPSLTLTTGPAQASAAKAERLARIPVILTDHPDGMQAEGLAAELGITTRSLNRYTLPSGIGRDRGRYFIDPNEGEDDA